MALDVKVKIDLAKVSGSIGFGIPLLLQGGAEKAVAYTVCYGIEDVVKAGFANDTEMYKAAAKVFAQDTKPAKIAICAATGTAVETLPTIVSKDWRQLVLVGAESTEYVGVADYIETTQNKMLFLSMGMTEWTTFKTSLEGKEYERTVILVNDTEYACAALVGMAGGRTAGSFTYKFKTLKGVVAEDLTDAQIDELHENGAFGYVTKAGDDITTEGISVGGMYIDIRDSIDYVVQTMEYNIQKTFNTTDKVHYDNRGIALLEAAATSALQEAFVNGIIAVQEDGVTPDYSVSFSARSATTEEDRASRVYPYGSFKFSLAGAIHECEVYGEVSY